MAKKVKRNRRASMHGWWKVLPFLLGPMALLMTFAHFESERLINRLAGNEYRIQIDALEREITLLEAANHDLSRYERIEKKKPQMSFHPRSPGRLVTILPVAVQRSLDDKANHVVPPDPESLPGRRVLVEIEYEIADSHQELGIGASEYVEESTGKEHEEKI